MKVNINNLGVIKNVTFDLDKKLSLLCGSNNSGKTYLSYIIYALSRNMSFGNLKFEKYPKLTVNTSDVIVLDIYKLEEVIELSFKSVISSLDSIYGISKEQVNHIFDKTDFKAIYTIGELENKIYALSVSEELDLKGVKYRFTKEESTFDVQVEMLTSDEDGTSEIVNYLLLYNIYKYFAFYPIKGAFISPVERNSIYTFSKELSISRNNIIDQLQKGGDLDPFELLFNSTNRYPLAISDGLKVSNDLVNLQKQHSKFYQLAESIEVDLLNGSLTLTDKGEYIFISNKSKNKKLPIHMSASIVKTLSSLVFYLKHFAEDGDLIIIDEPEMNLHPDAQIELTHLFVKLMRYGFRLLISTHSDYIIREFNNLIMLNRIEDKLQGEIEKLGYDIDDKIDPNDVACYFFRFKNSKSKNVIVESLKIDNNGVAIPTIDETIEHQNSMYEELLYLGSENS